MSKGRPAPGVPVIRGPHILVEDNDAAERLCECGQDMESHAGGFALLHHDEVMRRATVERIIKRLEDDYGWNPAHEVCQAILAAERDREVGGIPGLLAETQERDRPSQTITSTTPAKAIIRKPGFYDDPNAEGNDR